MFKRKPKHLHQLWGQAAHLLGRTAGLGVAVTLAQLRSLTVESLSISRSPNA